MTAKPFIYPMPYAVRPVTKHKIQFLIHVGRMRRVWMWN